MAAKKSAASEELLSRLACVATRRNRLREQFLKADEEMRCVIREAFGVRVTARAMEELTGLTASRLFQIRDYR